MTNSDAKFKIVPVNEKETDHVSSFYFDVNIFTEKKRLQGHKLMLARSSPWFHKYFQLREKMQICDIVFFNVSEKVVQSAIDVLYGKEITFPAKDKNKLTWFLTKLEVKWMDSDEPIENYAIDESPTIPVENPRSSSIFPPMPSPKRKLSDVSHPRDPIPVKKSTTTEEDLFAILDEFTETNAEELAKIGHMQIGESGNVNRSYKCLKCESVSKFFTQAEKHNLEHEHEAFSDVRATLKNTELERKSIAKSINKIEKGTGNFGKGITVKKRIQALRSVNFFSLKFTF